MKDYLNQNTNALLEEFWKFSKETEKMIEEMSLPIIIGDYVEKLGLNVVYDELYLFDQNKRDFGMISTKTIYVNPNISYKEQRWVIAKAVAIFLNDYNTENGDILGEGIFSIGNPFLVSRNVEEFYLDSLATLLLLPITLFKREVSENIEKSDDLLQHLSDRVQIPLFQLSIGYQLIKQMICYQRKKEFEKCNYDVELMPSEEYEDIFL